MRKKLLRCLILCALITAVTMSLMVTGGMYLFVSDQLRMSLSHQADTLSALLTGQEDPTAFLSAGTYMNRVTLVDDTGKVLYDSLHSPSGMDNHLGREEIARALEAGEAFVTRDSDTVGEKSVYYARRLPSGQVLRLAGTQKDVLSTLRGAAGWILLGAALCVLGAFLMARPITRRLVEPINAIDLDQPLFSDAYEELSPVLRRMDQQNRRIAQQIDALSHQRQEMDAILGGMREGLILLSQRRTVLTMNAAARAILGVEDDPVGQDVLSVNRNEMLLHLLEEGAGEGEMALHGRRLRVSISTVESGGMVLLFQDVTADRQAEESRRQFSANVSHELRTPLTTISGYAELLASGMARPEDAGEIGGKIYRESRRLLTLIEDILRLSRLDEGVMGEKTPVELLNLARSCAEKLAPLAKNCEVTLDVQGTAASILGDRALLEEMVTNLMENGVKYNHPGGRVTARVDTAKDGGAQIAVSDTGVGVAPEHQSRIFERFYRVDKSRSKQTGGTGLGLSIVKHGAQAHHAEISLESQVGKGTSITLSFPPPERG